MEAFIQENRLSFKHKIASFKPKNAATEDNSSYLVSDTVIAARVRPLLENEEKNGMITTVFARENSSYIDVHELRQKVNAKPGLNTTSFGLDRTYGPSDDSEVVYRDLVAPLVSWSWSGGVSTMFAYGQTGSGKTFSVHDLEKFAAAELMNGGLEGKRDVYICVCELVGNEAFDLLNNHRRVSVLEDVFGETQLVGIVEQMPSTSEELCSLIDTSMKFRKTAATVKNDTSSRSHAVCRIRIVNKDIDGSPDGLLFLIDLAGSEAAADIKDHSAERMKETREINISLSILKDCIRGRALASVIDNTSGSSKSSKAVHIPFRSSGITKVLKYVFDVNGERACKTAVLACVKPGHSDCRRSNNTLRYAEVLRVPVPKMKPPPFDAESPRTWSNKDTREWIEKNSGTPPISSSILAPTENGTQLVRLPKGEFLSRCQKSPGITPEHARAFFDKLWRLQVDSRSTQSGTATPDVTAIESQPRNTQPFQDRLKPGMFVRKLKRYGNAEGSIVMIMCPEHAFDGANKGGGGNKRYICACVWPAMIYIATENCKNKEKEAGMS